MNKSNSNPRILGTSDIGKLCDLTPEAVRYYERIGVVSPSRKPSGERNWVADDAATIQRYREERGLLKK